MSRDFYSFGGGWRWLQNLNGELNCIFFLFQFLILLSKNQICPFYHLLCDIRLVQDNLFVKDQKSFNFARLKNLLNIVDKIILYMFV